MKQLDNQLVTQAEYARHRGCSREAVRKAVQGGRITVFGPEQRVNVALADSQWAQNTRARLQTPAAPPDGQPGPNGAPAYDESRARRERAQADLAELELMREMRTVFDAKEVLGIVADVATAARASFEQMPDRLAPLLAGRTELEIVGLLRRYIEDTLEQMAQGFERIAAEGQDAG